MCNGVVTFIDGVATGATPGQLVRNPSSAHLRASGKLFTADRQKIRALREAGRGAYDLSAGVLYDYELKPIDLEKTVMHMPGPISRAFYKANDEYEKEGVQSRL